MANETTNYYDYVFKNSIKSDFKIILRNKTIQVHKQVLGPQNRVFLEKFTAHPRLNKIEILDVDPQAFEIFIDYLYTGKVSDGNITEELFLVAHRYADPNLKDLCREKLGRDLNVENVVGRLLTFLNCEEKRLIKKASVFLAKNFNDVKSRPEFKQVLETPAAISAVFGVFDELHISVLTFNNENPDRQALIESAKMSDMTIKVQNHIFLTHKEIISERSAVFKKTISTLLSNSSSPVTVNVTEFNPTVFKLFLDHIYDNTLSGKDISINLLSIAHAYADSTLKNICDFHLAKNITLANAVDYLVTGIKVESQRLEDAAAQFIAQHFKEVSVQPEFDRVQQNLKAVSAVFTKLRGCLDVQRSTSSYTNVFKLKVPSYEGIPFRQESEWFFINNSPWSIATVQIKSPATNFRFLGIFLLCHADDAHICPHEVTYTFRLISTVETSKDECSEWVIHTYDCKSSYGIQTFISWANLHDPNRGLIRDGKVSVRVDVRYLNQSK